MSWIKRILTIVLVSIVGPATLFAGTASVDRGANPPQPTIVFSQSSIPFIKASSGSIGNNCAITGLTTMTKTYSAGAWLYLPAGAIAAGVPAAPAWYWFVASSATAGTCYNSTYTSGVPTRGTTTAFATTGPGAFTGVTGAITGPSLVMPANTIGLNGRVLIMSTHTAGASGSGSSKTFIHAFGGSACSSISAASVTTWWQNCEIVNMGSASRQSLKHWFMNSSGTAATITFAADSTVATNAAVTFSQTINTALATDFGTIESYSILVYPLD